MPDLDGRTSPWFWTLSVPNIERRFGGAYVGWLRHDGPRRTFAEGTRGKRSGSGATERTVSRESKKESTAKSSARSARTAADRTIYRERDSDGSPGLGQSGQPNIPERSGSVAPAGTALFLHFQGFIQELPRVFRHQAGEMLQNAAVLDGDREQPTTPGRVGGSRI